MKLSAIVCTLNRCGLLRGAVKSLASQTLKSASYEIIVVDNGSTDGTRPVVEEAARRVANLRYVHEPETGLSIARNRGVKEARGEIVAFIDDDALAEPHWAEELCSAYDADPDTGAVGGRVEVSWPSHRPPWLPDAMEGYYGKFDLGAERRPISYPVYPYGLNMSMRRQLLLEAGGFSTRLGRTGKNLISWEEAEMFYRLSRRGVRVVYEPRAVVRHRIERERVSRRWLLRRAVADGRSQFIFERLHDGSGNNRRAWLRPMLRAARRASSSIRRALFLLVTPKAAAPALMHEAVTAAYSAGYALECLHVSRR